MMKGKVISHTPKVASLFHKKWHNTYLWFVKVKSPSEISPKLRLYIWESGRKAEITNSYLLKFFFAFNLTACDVKCRVTRSRTEWKRKNP